MAPRTLARPLQSLPPILHMLRPKPQRQAVVKVHRVFPSLLRVHGHFHRDTSISLSLWPRQRGDRYAIRAGRNLPDKEFRYLRTVIVTAAVYRGFDSAASLIANNSPLNLPAPGRRQSVYVALRLCTDLCF